MQRQRADIDTESHYRGSDKIMSSPRNCSGHRAVNIQVLVLGQGLEGGSFSVYVTVVIFLGKAPDK